MKIAVVGSAPSSMGLAPVNDPSWEIWACSPGVMGKVQRIDAFFEMHGIDTFCKNAEESLYLQWLRVQKKLYLLEQDPRFPNSVRYPIEEMIEQFGGALFASTVSYMVAYAITQKPEAIGLFGVDMSATEEYSHQRIACQALIREAKRSGIEIIIPPESDIQYPSPLYGYQELDPHWIKLNARRSEMLARVQMMERQVGDLNINIARLRGAIDDMAYHMQTNFKGCV